jgi:hypothetical protein
VVPKLGVIPLTPEWPVQVKQVSDGPPIHTVPGHLPSSPLPESWQVSWGVKRATGNLQHGDSYGEEAGPAMMLLVLCPELGTMPLQQGYRSSLRTEGNDWNLKIGQKGRELNRKDFIIKDLTESSRGFTCSVAQFSVVSTSCAFLPPVSALGPQRSSMLSTPPVVLAPCLLGSSLPLQCARTPGLESSSPVASSAFTLPGRCSQQQKQESCLGSHDEYGDY